MNINVSLVLVTMILFCLTGCRKNQTNYKVFIITGGKKIERESFFKIFDDLSTIDYKEITQPQANDMYSSPEIDRIDVLIFYDMVQKINEEQKLAFLQVLKNGKGVIFLHHSLVSYQEWYEFEKIIGGRFYQSTNKADSNKYPQSTYRHDVMIPVQIVNADHPVTKGVDDFVIHDEVYGNYKILPNVDPLLSTTHPESEKVIGWTNTYGNSRIVYIQLGHDHHAFDDPHYRRLIKQAIEWAARY